MQFKQNQSYALLAPTSMGVRLTPENRQSVHTSRSFFMQASSAESNVLTIGASLGLKVKLLTKFVKQSPVAELIKRDLRARGIDFEGKETEQGGAWGCRHQFNIADSGFGARGPRVWNDRAGEVGRTLCAADFELERIFRMEGAQILHLSGLIAALSESTAEFCLTLAQAARDNGSKVSFDLNYRASFWKGREQELSDTFKKIAALSDILIGNEEDFQLALGMEGPEAGGGELERKIDAFIDMTQRVRKRYPNVELCAATLREVESANRHRWGAIVTKGDTAFVEQPREIEVLDRIGGGDGFVGGLLYGLLRGYDVQKSMRFGWATGALAVTMLEDYATPMDEAQVWSIYEGNARVSR